MTTGGKIEPNPLVLFTRNMVKPHPPPEMVGQLQGRLMEEGQRIAEKAKAAL